MIEIVLLITNLIILILIMGMANELLEIRDFIFYKEVYGSESNLRDNREL